MDINTNAPAFARHHIVIEAPIHRIWNLLSDINHWPLWNPTITYSRLEGPFSPGTVFRWRSQGASIVSTLQEVIPEKRLSWNGKAFGAKAIHVWELKPQDSAVMVKTEESFDGFIVWLLKGMMQKTLDQSLQSWLSCLKQAAENPK